MMLAFSTRAAAEAISRGLDMPGAVSAKFVRGDIDDGLLIARIHVKREGRSDVDGRARKTLIQIHVDDLIAYARRQWPRAVAHIEALKAEAVAREEAETLKPGGPSQSSAPQAPAPAKPRKAKTRGFVGRTGPMKPVIR
jgi:hypothetical protein